MSSLNRSKAFTTTNGAVLWLLVGCCDLKQSDFATARTLDASFNDVEYFLSNSRCDLAPEFCQRSPLIGLLRKRSLHCSQHRVVHSETIYLVDWPLHAALPFFIPYQLQQSSTTLYPRILPRSTSYTNTNFSKPTGFTYSLTWRRNRS